MAKSKFDPSFCERAHEYALMGATDAEMAEAFGVAESTFYEWQKIHPEFSEAIKTGKSPADASVACALYNRATGAEWTEEQAIKVKTVEYADGKRVREEERVEIVEVKRAAAPDTTAAIFWLKNRRKDDWRDRKEHELSGPDGGPIVTQGKLPPEVQEIVDRATGAADKA